MVLRDLDSYMQKKKKGNSTTKLIPYTKINSTWIKDLKISHDTIKVLQENIHRKMSGIPHSNIFTNMSPSARDIKEKINKLDFIKIKSFSTSKENISKMKMEPTIWENIFANDISEKCLTCSTYKNFTWLLTRMKTIQLKHGQRT